MKIADIKELAEHAVQLGLEYPNFTDEHVYDWIACGSVPFTGDDLYQAAEYVKFHEGKAELSIEALINETIEYIKGHPYIG